MLPLLSSALLGTGLFYLFQQDGGLPIHIVFETAVVVAFGGGLTLANGWYVQTGISSADATRTLMRMIAGMLAVVIVAGGVVADAWLQGNAVENIGFILLLASYVGASSGFLFGVQETRTLRTARLEAEATLRAEEAERRNRMLRYLTHVLRHHVLNGVNVISGYAGTLPHDETEQHRDAVGRISERSDRIVSLVESIQQLVDAVTEPTEPKAMNLAEVLHSSVAAARRRHPHADIGVSEVPTVTVCSDHLLELAFAQLLDNAVVHHDAARPQVDIDIDERARTVAVVVADDGPGIPAHVYETYLTPPVESVVGRGDHLGLYLVRTILNRYDGDVHVTDREPCGTTVTVGLPKHVEDDRSDLSARTLNTQRVTGRLAPSAD